jgi:hypothetical protein
VLQLGDTATIGRALIVEEINSGSSYIGGNSRDTGGNRCCNTDMEMPMAQCERNRTSRNDKSPVSR